MNSAANNVRYMRANRIKIKRIESKRIELNRLEASWMKNEWIRIYCFIAVLSFIIFKNLYKSFRLPHLNRITLKTHPKQTIRQQHQQLHRFNLMPHLNIFIYKLTIKYTNGKSNFPL